MHVTGRTINSTARYVATLDTLHQKPNIGYTTPTTAVSQTGWLVRRMNESTGGTIWNLEW